MGSVHVHTHVHRRQTLPWKWIRWQMVSEPELLSRAEFMLSCSPPCLERKASNKSHLKKKSLISSWQSVLSLIMSDTTLHHLFPSTSRVLAGKILCQIETKEETNIDLQPPSLRNTRNSVFHKETRTCYYQPKYQNPGHKVWRRTRSLRSIKSKGRVGGSGERKNHCLCLPTQWK